MPYLETNLEADTEIELETDLETDLAADLETDLVTDPVTDLEADLVEEQQIIRKSIRLNKGKAPKRYNPSNLITLIPKDLNKELVSVRTLIALIGAPKEYFYTLFIAILEEVNYTY